MKKSKAKAQAQPSEKEFAASLEERMADFEKNGGKIQSIKTGASALFEKPATRHIVINPKK